VAGGGEVHEYDVVRDALAPVGLAVEQPAAGIMETDWAENRAKLPHDIIRGTIGKVIDSVYSTGELDKFRTRVERTATGSDIYVTHRRMEEVYTNSRKEQTVWQPGAVDPQLEATFLSRLMIKLGAKDEPTKTAAATTPGAPGTAPPGTAPTAATPQELYQKQTDAFNAYKALAHLASTDPKRVAAWEAYQAAKAEFQKATEKPAAPAPKVEAPATTAPAAAAPKKGDKVSFTEPTVVYKDGKPVTIEHYLKFNSAGPQENDLVFVSGSPGHTDRELSVSELADLRDRLLPQYLAMFYRREVALESYGERATENARRARDDLHRHHCRQHRCNRRSRTGQRPFPLQQQSRSARRRHLCRLSRAADADDHGGQSVAGELRQMVLRSGRGQRCLDGRQPCQ
jgi:hypothetical protein